MPELLLNSLISGLLWYPFVLAMGCSYQYLKRIDVSVDGVAVISGIAAALAWRYTRSYVASVAFATAAGALSGCLVSWVIHQLRIASLVAGIVISMLFHSLSVLLVGESIVLTDSSFAGSRSAIAGVLVLVTLVLAAVATLFYRTNFGLLLRALSQNPHLNSPISPVFVATVGIVLSGAFIGLGSAIFVHSEGVARSGGGFDFLLTGLTSFLATDRIAGWTRKKFHRNEEMPRRSSLAVVAEFVGSVPVVALVGSIAFQLLIYVVLRWAPRPESWKMIVATILVLTLGRIEFRRWAPYLPKQAPPDALPDDSKLRVQALEKTWNGRSEARPLFRNLSFAVGRGLFVLSGVNGSGKSTLLRCLNGDTTFERGTVEVVGRNVRDVPQYRRGLFFLRQDPRDNVAGELKVYELISCLICTSSKPMHIAVRKTIGEMLAHITSRTAHPLHTGLLSQYTDSLSGGELQVLSVLVALLSRKPVILADEPTANLDATNRQRISELLSLAGHDRTVLAASHDEALRAVADEVLTLDGLRLLKEQK